MQSTLRFSWFRTFALVAFGISLSLGVLPGCGDGTGSVLRVDAEFNPEAVANSTYGIHEGALSVGQTFTVQNDGDLSEFQILLTQAAAGSTGRLNIDIRPVNAAVPESDSAGAIFTPLVIDTTTLPTSVEEEFSIFSSGDVPVTAGQSYAIVVTFNSRTSGSSGQPIALLLGRSGDEFAGGTGAQADTNTGFVSVSIDYFFRTFLLIAEEEEEAS